MSRPATVEVLSKSQWLALQKLFPTDALIAAQYGVTRQAIQQLRKKMEVPRTTKTLRKGNGNGI